ncbi:hypothetical protein QBC39DRAFT_432226 [Podospora conica]|nr:hypothetical protein QBC39DRAFT_432226 [Schizothecium conicum]
MSSQLDVELATVAAQPEAQRAEAYKTILGSLKQFSSPSSLAADFITIADSIFESAGGVVSTRTSIDHLIDALKTYVSQLDLIIQVGRHVVDAIAERNNLLSSLFDQAATLRNMMASAHEDKDDYLEAAKVLSETPVDSTQLRVPDNIKAAIWVRIVRDYLEADDSTAAETYLNKLKNVMHDVTDPETQLHFKLSAARIQDANRQFLAAAASYHDISFSPTVADEDRVHSLAAAVKCAILAPAGPPRSRMLGRLYKDERAVQLPDHGILEKMFLDRLLVPAEVEKFAQTLSPHQLATTSDGSTVLAKAVVEHNLLGASRLYDNIGFDALGRLLGLDGDKAEETTARMIEQGRLLGSIDQIDRTIYFEGREASGEKGSGRAEVLVGKETRRWDSNVQAVAEEVEQLADALQAEFPEFVAEQIAIPTEKAREPPECKQYLMFSYVSAPFTPLLQVLPPDHHITLVERRRVAILLGKHLFVASKEAPLLDVHRRRRRRPVLLDDLDEAHADLVADQVVALDREVDLVVPVLVSVRAGHGEVGDRGVEVKDVAGERRGVLLVEPLPHGVVADAVLRDGEGEDLAAAL